MAENYLSGRPGYGRTFSTAICIIGLIASIQIIVLGFGALRRGPAPKTVELAPVVALARLPEQVPVPVMAQETLPAPPDLAPAPVVGTTRQIGNPSSGGIPTPPSIVPTPPSIVPALSSIVPPSIVPTPSFIGPAVESESQSLSASLEVAARAHELAGEPILERLMSTGAELRASGNMQGALQAFRQVETALADHPRVLAELAATLSQMGLREKANSYWERVEGLGPVQAGAYFPLAGQQLRGELPPAADTTPKPMKISEVKVEENAPTSEGQKVTLRVIVDADPNTRPIGDDLTLLVYFYDKIAGGAVKASTANTSYLYPSKPYDWQENGTEEIVVNYSQPVFTEEQTRELGERSYYGYAIELYYRDQIQDTVVIPEDIADLNLEAKEPEKRTATEAETAPGGPILGPENALFPNSVYP